MTTSMREMTDSDSQLQPVNRRDALRRGASATGGLAAAVAFGSIPFALAALSRVAGAQAPTSIRGVLEFAYVLENLEAEFYKAVLGQSALAAQNAAFAPVRSKLTDQEKATLDQIRKHEVAHVAFLKGQLSSLGGSPATYTGAEFDFTGGQGSGTGPLAIATSDKGALLAGAQAFEDTGVRAYKGQAGNLMGNRAVLQAALQIHAVEARHAARVRRMRAAAGSTVNMSGTITQEQSGISGLPAAGQALIAKIYAGEANTIQGGVNVTSFATAFGGADAASEAFDEPLSYDQVIEIVTPFLVT